MCVFEDKYNQKKYATKKFNFYVLSIKDKKQG